MLTSDELDAMLAKIKAYEAAAPGDWMRKVVLLADTPDTGGNFRASSESLTPLLGAYDTQKIYRGVKTVGDAVEKSLEAFAVSGHYDFVFQVYTLLGDPASVIQRTGSP